MASDARWTRRSASIKQVARGRGGVPAVGVVVAAVALAATGCTASGPATGFSAPTMTPNAVVTQSGATATGSAVAAGDSKCTTLDISSGAGIGGAGHSHTALTLIFTNNGPRACSVQGYPSVALLLPAGGAYNAERTMNGYMGGDNAQSPAPVSLAPGQSATALIEWADTPRNGNTSFSAADCTGYGAASSLNVTLPDQTASQTVDDAFPNSPICRGFEVHPIVAGSTGKFPASS